MLISALFSFLNLTIEGLAAVVVLLISLLPPSPFLFFDSIEIPYIDSLNWVIPFSFFITTLSYWVSAILLYYLIQTVLRWVKMIE